MDNVVTGAVSLTKDGFKKEQNKYEALLDAQNQIMGDRIVEWPLIYLSYIFKMVLKLLRLSNGWVIKDGGDEGGGLQSGAEKGWANTEGRFWGPENVWDEG